MRLALAVLGVCALCGIFAPVLIKAFGLPGPEVRDTAAISRSLGMPTGPGAGHPLGVDELGRDVLSRTFFGARVSLSVALGATALTLLIGVVAGLLAGFYGGPIDTLLSRLIEAFLVVPFLLLAVGIASSCSTAEGCLNGTIKPGLPLVILVIGLAGWPILGRVVRNHALIVGSQEFVEAARVAGLPGWRIMLTEVLPNLRGTILTFAILLVPQAILTAAALNYLGVGVPESTASWGGMIAGAAPLFPEAWWYMLPPGLFLLVTVVACVVLAESLFPVGSIEKRLGTA